MEPASYEFELFVITHDPIVRATIVRKFHGERELLLDAHVNGGTQYSDMNRGTYRCVVATVRSGPLLLAVILEPLIERPLIDPPPSA